MIDIVRKNTFGSSAILAENRLLCEGYQLGDGICVSDFLNAFEKCSLFWLLSSLENKEKRFDEWIENSRKHFGKPSEFFINVKSAGLLRYGVPS